MKKILLMVLVLLSVCFVSFGCSKADTSKSDSLVESHIKEQSKDNKEEKEESKDSKDEKKEEKEESKDNKEEQKEESKDNKDEQKEDEKVPSKKEQYVICIDPGHQIKGDLSKEPIGPGSSEMKYKVSYGTQGVATNIPEYEINLQASKILRSYLQSMGFKVIMTRESHNVNISNAERAVFANDNNADLVIRIHADGSTNPNTNGASLQIPASNGKYTKGIYKESNKCAVIMSSAMKNAGFKVNNIYQRSDLTGFNWSEVPAVLVEMGFMSNAEEDQKLSQKSYQQKMMKAVANATKTYFKNR